jgi:hypothetical protein
MLTQIDSFCENICALLRCSQHLHSSQGSMARLFLGTCSSDLPGAYAQSRRIWTQLLLFTLQVASDHVLFLEKIADMFEVMANVLPPYQEIYVVCRQRMDNVHVATEDERLTTLMSYAYADLVKVCLDCYRIFFRDNHSKSLHSRCNDKSSGKGSLNRAISPCHRAIPTMSRNDQTIGTWWYNDPTKFSLCCLFYYSMISRIADTKQTLNHVIRHVILRSGDP